MNSNHMRLLRWTVRNSTGSDFIIRFNRARFTGLQSLAYWISLLTAVAKGNVCSEEAFISFCVSTVLQFLSSLNSVIFNYLVFQIVAQLYFLTLKSELHTYLITLVSLNYRLNNRSLWYFTVPVFAFKLYLNFDVLNFNRWCFAFDIFFLKRTSKFSRGERKQRVHMQICEKSNQSNLLELTESQ